ncbi:molybdopterin-guanine dinucleotide biosynthesis protein B [Planifilum fimeticola]|jgi:molybdopterin-guanine dinucleotide biosynthesis protein B
MKGTGFPPVVQVVGYSNSGKTTLICRLIPLLTQRGVLVGTLKHHAKALDLDRRGKDTWRHREAGARVVSISAENQSAVWYREPRSMEELLTHYAGLDVVLAEGFKEAGYPKLVVLREREHVSLLERLTNIRAVVSWFPDDHPSFPWYGIDEVEAVAEEVLSILREPTA